LITALNIAYEEKERRGFFKLNMLALGLTLAQLVGGLLLTSRQLRRHSYCTLPTAAIEWRHEARWTQS
jgi:hypothetical protein